MRLLIALVGTLLVAGAGPTVAGAQSLGGTKWPGRTITYHASAPGWGKAIRAAVRDWNSSGVRIRFKETSRARAKLRIVDERISGGALLGSAGEATLGWAAPGAVTRRSFKGLKMGGDAPCGFPIRTPLGRGRIKCDRGPGVWLDRLPANARNTPRSLLVRRVVVAHELGHTLGLKHAHPKCSVMSYKRDARCPQPPHPWQARCRVLEAGDVRAAIRRYGGRMRPLAPEFCDVDLEPAPLTPVDLRGTFYAYSRSVNVEWTAPTGPAVAEYGFAAGAGSCPTEPTERLGPSADQYAYPVGARSGPFCFVVWAIAKSGRSSAPATVWVDVPPEEDPAPSDGY